MGVRTELGNGRELTVHRACLDWVDFGQHADLCRQRLLFLRYRSLREVGGSPWIAGCPTLPGSYWIRFGAVPDEPPVHVEAELVESGAGLLCRGPGDGATLSLPEDWRGDDRWQAVRPWD